MPISTHLNFDSTIKWARPPGCLHCGSNVSDLGSAVGIQCVDLGVDDPFLGRFGLCYDCAVQVALAIDYTSKDGVLEVVEEARRLADEATTQDEEIRALAAQARIDRDVVERLVGAVYLEADTSANKASTELADAVSAAV